MKRQISVPEDLKKAEEDQTSLTEIDIRRPFEEEVCRCFSFLINYTSVFIGAKFNAYLKLSHLIQLTEKVEETF